MAFQLERGLATFDHIDHHAILGVPIDANASDIRKRYMKVVRLLHPDSRGTEDDKQEANQILSKLVNPAYEVLSQEKQRSEYEVLLRLLGQRLVDEKAQFQLQDQIALQLLQIADFDGFYRQNIQSLAEGQYQSLHQVVATINQLSELNTAYLLRREGGTKVSTAEPASLKSAKAHPPSPAGSNPGTPGPTPGPTRQSEATSKVGVNTATPVETFVSQYYRRAEEFLGSGNFQAAILELRDALKLDPQNSRCQSLMGAIYLKQKQYTMAKVHFTQALKLNPEEIDALKGMEIIQKVEKKDQQAKARAAQPAQKPKSGGLFGLFGGKKK